ncbi:hypothetical protein BN14_11481 [Rhizoctonia solani AG-1 IB]|uniref:Uncharacterized protein n=1 Tax=Thanatephorus cucumeris (strain AG1-IB / isolate 7/3/14) TaxID=1108050 RepID=M5CD02_THACB|nr:hypothetical protein BN14_11481 [Rhizoctonia solani AG-1 IB]
MTASFPYDFMHLIYENLVPNLIQHWTGTFKHLDQGSEHYVLTLAQWIAIGVETAAATRTTPGSFVGTLPNIAQDQSLYTAEAYGFWIQYIAPIVLKGRLSNKYYQHVLDLRAILDLCLQFEIPMEQIDELELWIIRWVADYKAYFQFVLSGQNLSLAEPANLIRTDLIVRYGRVRIANGGDSTRTSDSIYNKENAGNSSYVRFNMFPDRNTARRRADDDPFRQVNYGELLDIFYVKLKDHGDPDIGRTFLLARVLLCQLLKWKDGSKEVDEYKEMESSPSIINLLTIESTIGRVQRHKTLGIIDRSRNAVRTLFADDDKALVY